MKKKNPQKVCCPFKLVAQFSLNNQGRSSGSRSISQADQKLLYVELADAKSFPKKRGRVWACGREHLPWLPTANETEESSNPQVPFLPSTFAQTPVQLTSPFIEEHILASLESRTHHTAAGLTPGSPERPVDLTENMVSTPEGVFAALKRQNRKEA